MYWSEWGVSPKIKKAGMDGSNPRVLLMNTGYATGLTLDFEKKRLFWAETKSPTIYSSDLNGFNKKILVSDGFEKPIGLTLYKDTLYWADESKFSIDISNLYIRLIILLKNTSKLSSKHLFFRRNISS